MHLFPARLARAAAVAALLAQTGLALPQAPAEMPRLGYQEGRDALFVDGEPYLVV